MGKPETVENIVELEQTVNKTKKFRPDYPVSEDLRQVMVSEVFRDFMIYALDLYYDNENLSLLREFVEEHNPKAEKQQGLLDNLFWWRLLYDSGPNPVNSCFDDYISDNHYTLRNKPFIKSWLRECKNVVPKFYFIGHKYNDRTFVAIDILTHESLDVIVYAPIAIPPKQGEIAMGTLIPLGGGLFFPIIDFYHFDYEAREAMSSCIHHHYEKHLKTSSMKEAFFQVVSVMLQIERIIFMQNQEKSTSK
ncbi:hypothetical protein [Bacillus sp. X1(2014)]|uniref:hypothetical protein n=1 Tax=Bacillus sp. X1(2014) TaxID=1565991 RepID=UPI0011A40613|nr:hypothetical protein [Bacillus sp. X1(2014)]